MLVSINQVTMHNIPEALDLQVNRCLQYITCYKFSCQVSWF